MARELSFRISTAAPVDDVRQVLRRSPGFAAAADGRTVAAGVTDATVRGESAVGRDTIKDEFGFEPDVRVVFRLDKFDEWENGVQTALGACASLIKEFRADAILLEDGEYPLFTARAGVLHFNDAPDFWTPDRRAAIMRSG